MFLDPADEPKEIPEDPGDFSHAGCSGGECGGC